MRKNIGCNAHHFRRKIGDDWVCMYCGHVDKSSLALSVVDQAIAINSSYKYANIQDDIQMAWLSILSQIDRVRKSK